MFRRRFLIIEIRDNGMKITHYIKGKKKDVNEMVSYYKSAARTYEMFNRKGMVVWM